MTVEPASARAAVRPEPPAGVAGREVVHLVPHTHWDREWYLPWQRFRMRLVGLVDGLLDEMGADDRVRFTLDGQTATVDDYLQIRPERAAEVERLVREGRLAVGPWRILMDEFLVSGETLVRNLEMGVRRASELGRVMAIGYLPDMFGHVAQMPQILRRAGIDDAVVWRGVPAVIDRHAFTWRSPDGSAVRCEYLLGGYGNGRDVLALADRIGRKLDVFVALQRSTFGDDELLAMYGEDHSIPRPGYAELVAEYNRSQDRFEIRIETLAEAIAALRRGSAPQQAWDGELRSSARANVLMGVISHRVEVKQAAGRVERLLERLVEPLWALHGESWPRALLDEAWRRVVENSAHDSICACSAEATVAQVLVRFGEAEQIGNGLLDRLVVTVGDHAPRDAYIVLNPTPATRTDVVTLEVPLPVDASDDDRVGLVDEAGTPIAIQDEGLIRRMVREATIDGSEVIAYLRRRLHARELYGHQVNGYRSIPPRAPDDVHELTVDVDLAPDPDELDMDELLDRLAAETALAPRSRWHVAVVTRPRRRLMVLATVPPLGWSSLAPAPIAGAPSGPTNPVAVGERGLSNGLVSVRVADDGTLAFEADGTIAAGVARIVDGGDVGDSYNYAPPLTDSLVERPSSCQVTVGRRGPLVGELTVRRLYDWPVGLLDDRSGRASETVPSPVAMTVELRANEPFVRLSVELDNRSVDHRVRLHVPLPRSARRSWAEGQFAIVERGLEMEGGHGEVPLPTFPAHGFVVAGGVAVIVEHVTEYELVGRTGAGPATELALTLVRATGFISRDNHPYRDEPAGPVIAAPTGQAQGVHRLVFALMAAPHGASDPAVLEAADRVRHPFVVGSGGGTRPASPGDPRPGLSVDGEAIVLSSLRRREEDSDRDVLELRLVREAPGPGTATVGGSFDRFREVDILGQPSGPWMPAAGRLELRLAGWEIRTVQLGRPPAA
ncbi:MAG TPA: hypothetical protein VFI28_10970 [Candidatus Limnocylindrales bacterium]|nr:hypothetical protein [Candidatus Limnocylindrales bacterium]